MKRTLITLFLSHAIALAATAQEAVPASEFGRTSGGAIEAITKGPRKLSGSLGITSSGSLKGYEATLGGTVVRDRVWFFASAFQQEGLGFQTSAQQIQPRDIDRLAFVKSTAQLGDSHVLDTSVVAGSSPFLSLRYTGVISNNMLFSASFSRSSSSSRFTVLNSRN